MNCLRMGLQRKINFMHVHQVNPETCPSTCGSVIRNLGRVERRDITGADPFLNAGPVHSLRWEMTFRMSEKQARASLMAVVSLCCATDAELPPPIMRTYSLGQPASRMSHSKQKVLWGRPTQCRLRFLRQGRLPAHKRHTTYERQLDLRPLTCIPIWTQHPPGAQPSCMSQLEAILSLHEKLVECGECRTCCEAFPTQASNVFHANGHAPPSPILYTYHTYYSFIYIFIYLFVYLFIYYIYFTQTYIYLCNCGSLQASKFRKQSV